MSSLLLFLSSNIIALLPASTINSSLLFLPKLHHLVCSYYFTYWYFTTTYWSPPTLSISFVLRYPSMSFPSPHFRPIYNIIHLTIASSSIILVLKFPLNCLTEPASQQTLHYFLSGGYVPSLYRVIEIDSKLDLFLLHYIYGNLFNSALLLSS